MFIPKKKEPEEEELDDDEDQPAYESQSEESVDDKRKVWRKEVKTIGMIYMKKGKERMKMDPMPSWFQAEKW